MNSVASRTALSGRLTALAVIALLIVPAATAQYGQDLWSDVDPQQVSPVSDRGVEPLVFRSLAVDLEGMAAHLAAAPMEETPGVLAEGQLVALPLPGGGFATYRVVESPVMHPGLQSRYPSIRTYLGVDVDDPTALLRLSVTPQGFHVISRRPEGTLYIDPFTQFDLQHVKAYWRHDLPPRDPHLHPPDEVEELDGLGETLDEMMQRGEADGGVRFVHGEQLRVYRAAIAANRFYSAFHSTDSSNPSVEETLAAIAVALNRINQIYERDLTVRMVLIENNHEIIYTTASEDPYGNSPGTAILSVNQSNLDSVIGSANYDIGHVFITGGGGIATLRSVCTSGKARGVTGLPNPINDPFYVDYVSHEIGHQFGANHTFNAGGGCLGQRNASTAVEPGSGSTIMAYSGLCSGQNIQGLSDDYFNNISLTEMITFITSGAGGTCGEPVATGNDVPDPILPAQYQVPALTGFALTGDADYDGDKSALTFVWEGRDTGPAGPPPGLSGWDHTAPFFRSFTPTASPTRFFPRIDRFVQDQLTLGEGLPNSTGILRFRLTVRNNAPGGGALRDRQLLTSVAGAAGPFVVTSHNESDIQLVGGQQVTITWDVANSNTSALGGENVDIVLSLDRHHDIVAGTAIVLAEAVPNNGAATVTLPEELTANRARFFVRANPGYFFSFNIADMGIEPGVSTENGAPTAAAELSPVFPNPAGVGGARATVNLEVDRAQSVRVAVFDALGREVMVLHDGPVVGGTNHQFAVTARALAAGIYYVRANGENFSLTRPLTVVH